MNNLYKALADFQQEVPAIYKGTSGYGYKYADWSEIIEKITPVLKKHGLGFTQPLDGTNLKTIVFHVESGETIEGIVEIPQGVELKGMNDFQVMGSAITYLRRYSLSAMLGLVTDEDADAAGEQIKTGVNKSPKWTPSKTKPASDNQKNFIANLLRQHGVDTDNMKEYLATEYGVSSEMSQADAQHIIDDLNGTENK